MKNILKEQLTASTLTTATPNTDKENISRTTDDSRQA